MDRVSFIKKIFTNELLIYYSLNGTFRLEWV